MRSRALRSDCWPGCEQSEAPHPIPGPRVKEAERQRQHALLMRAMTDQKVEAEFRNRARLWDEMAERLSWGLPLSEEELRVLEKWAANILTIQPTTEPNGNQIQPRQG